MNYGLYISAAGALTNLHRQDVLANNLANLNTIGFKPDDVSMISRLPQRLESSDLAIDPQFLLENLGGGQFAGPTRTNFRQGEVTETGNDLDLAIQGDGFFVVDSRRSGSPTNGARSSDPVRLTRDGRFTINATGELVMIANGMRVLDINDLPIRLNRGARVRVNADGALIQNGVAVARLQVSTVADKAKLVKEGADLFKIGAPPASKGFAKRQPAGGMVRQGSIESSAVDPIMALNAMINASKAVQANATMMQYHDNIIGQAVNTLGRVA
jgi:flagellar basal-body rod protein FlgF